MYSSLDIYNKSITQAVTTVASPNAAYQRMAQFWDLIADLKEGTYKIRSEIGNIYRSWRGRWTIAMIADSQGVQ